MNARGLFVLSVAVYSVLPLVYVLLGGRVRSVLLYTHVASLLVLGTLIGRSYVLPLVGTGDDAVRLGAGQIAFGGFLFAALVTALVGRGLHVVRHLLALVVAVKLLGFAVAAIGDAALDDGLAPRADATPFTASLDAAATSTLVVLVVLVAMLGVIEVAKARVGTAWMVPVYVLSYGGSVVLGGALIAVVVIRPATGLGDLLARQALSHLVLAAAFAVPLLVFVLAYRPTVRGFEQRPLGLRRLLTLSRSGLLARVRVQQAELDDQRRRLVTETATTQRILDAATDTILVAVDLDLRITHANSGAARLLRLDPEEVVGREVADLHTDDEIGLLAEELGCPATYADLLRAQVAHGGARDWEFVVGPECDDRLMVSLSITTITSHHAVIGYVLAGADITSRRRAEEADHAALARLREADEVKRHLVSTVSHELRTPISSILGYTELLADGGFGDLDAEQAMAVEKVRRNTHRLARIVSDLLTLDRTEDSQLTADLVPLDLADLVRSYDDTLDDLVAGREVQLIVRLPDAPVPVLGDGASLQRVVGNLVGNAVKFVLDPGEVTVRVEADHRCARLTVSDTGIGIADGDRDHLFERFYRAPEAGARAIPGSGLGLAIVKAIVDEHDGRIEVDSARGEGTSVTVTLPLRAAG